VAGGTDAGWQGTCAGVAGGAPAGVAAAAPHHPLALLPGLLLQEALKNMVRAGRRDGGGNMPLVRLLLLLLGVCWPLARAVLVWQRLT